MTDVVDEVADELDEAVETVEEVVDEVANQLGETVETLGDTLDEAGTDLGEVTQDVIKLVEAGVPLEDAVEQVLGLLPLPETTQSPPASTDSSDTPLGGLLGY